VNKMIQHRKNVPKNSSMTPLKVVYSSVFKCGKPRPFVHFLVPSYWDLCNLRSPAAKKDPVV
jgi:hypothetical protein